MAEKRWMLLELAPQEEDRFVEDSADDLHKARIVSTGQTVETSSKLVPVVLGIPPAAVAPAAAAAPSADTQSAPTQCCDAYPADALTAALGTAVDPKVLWRDIPEPEQHKLAESLTEKAAAARIDLLEKSAWATAPEMVLLDACAQADRPGLAKKMLEIRTGATDADYERRSAEAGLAKERTETAEVLRETLTEAKRQMETWRELAGLGKLLLIVAGAFSAVAILLVIILAAIGKLGEVETPIIVFALAVFAISPAVLLLRERPLEGLDKWTPSGPTKEEEKSGEGEGDSSGSKGSAGTAAGG